MDYIYDSASPTHPLRPGRQSIFISLHLMHHELSFVQLRRDRVSYRKSHFEEPYDMLAVRTVRFRPLRLDGARGSSLVMART